MAELSQAQPPVVDAGAAHPRQRRPRAVTFVAILSMLEGLAVVASAAVVGAEWSIAPAAMLESDVLIGVPGAAVLAVGGGSLVLAAFGLLRLRAWAWTLTVATHGLVLTLALYDYLSGDPDYRVMALGVLAVFLLNRREVRLAFEPPGRRRD